MRSLTTPHGVRSGIGLSDMNGQHDPTPPLRSLLSATLANGRSGEGASMTGLVVLSSLGQDGRVLQSPKERYLRESEIQPVNTTQGRNSR